MAELFVMKEQTSTKLYFVIFMIEGLFILNCHDCSDKLSSSPFNII